MATENATDERQFAYGFNQYKACECPAVTAGYHPTETSSLALKQVVDQFDKQVEEYKGHEAGQVCESVARKVWLDLLETYEDGTIQYREHERITRNIAEKLGWIEE